jgi:hypothetical protein
MRKTIAISFLLILALSSITFSETLASTPKPSIPEFTVKLVDSSYDVPASSSIDPYTGQTITNPAEHVDNRTIEVKVKNQPFTPYTDDKSSFTIKLYYNIRVRGHFGGNWTEVFSVDNAHPVQSNSDYTIISLPLGGNVGPFASLPTNSSSQVDCQVEAMIGYFSRSGGVFLAPWYFAGEESGWSGTQTVTISAPDASSSPSSIAPSSSGSSPSPMDTPFQTNVGSSVLFGLDWVGVAVIALLAAVLVLLLVFVVVFLRRRAVR